MHLLEPAVKRCLNGVLCCLGVQYKEDLDPLLISSILLTYHLCLSEVLRQLFAPIHAVVAGSIRNDEGGLEDLYCTQI